ncbi:MAG: hypothetical protein ACTHU0_06780 [Kofleriaceae bacterium]
MRALLASALLLAFACRTPSSTSAPPAPSPGSAAPTGEPGQPAPADCGALEPGAAMTPDQCSCRSGRVNLSRGGGDQAHCAEGETELGTVRIGIEGGWCCKAP